MENKDKVRSITTEYYNPNPKGRLDADDCVMRALCNVTGMSWYDLFDMYAAAARENAECICITDKGYRRLIRKLGGIEQKTPWLEGNHRMRTGDFIDMLNKYYSSGEGIIAIATRTGDGISHMTSFRNMDFMPPLEDGFYVPGYRCWDTFDCTPMFIGTWWVVPPLKEAGQ